MVKRSRAFIINADGDRLLVTSIVCNEDIVDDTTDIKFIKIEGLLDGEGDPFMTTTRDDVYKFLNGDTSVLKEEYDIVVTPTRTRLAAHKEIVREYKNYILDKTCTIKDDTFTIYIKQDRYGEMAKVTKNMEDNLDLMETIVEMYEDTVLNGGE